jgi:hypothetical protein
VIANNQISMSLISLRRRKLDIVQSRNDGRKRTYRAALDEALARCAPSAFSGAFGSVMAVNEKRWGPVWNELTRCRHFRRKRHETCP